jgi:transposase InsO family protein
VVTTKQRRQVVTHLIAAFPDNNARRACANWFASLPDAQRAIDVWRVEYNEERPHKNLGRRTSAEFTKSLQSQTFSPAPRLTA